MNFTIKLSSSHLTGDEIGFINDALYLNEIGTSGNNLQEFEKELKAITSASNIVLLNNGTAAVHLALVLLGVDDNDEVICPTFCSMATVNSVIYQGAKPLFVDCEEDTWCMSPLMLECAIKDRLDIGRRPKTIIVSHAYGNPAKINELMEVAQRFSIPVIEDAMISIGSLYNNKYTGTFGIFGVYSFAANNIITSSCGAALVSDNELLIQKARELNEHHFNTAYNHHLYQIGYNYLMSNVCAGIGRAQLKVLEERVRQRRENFSYYRAALNDFPGIKFQNEADRSKSNRCVTCIKIDSKKSFGLTAEKLRHELTSENIETYPLYKPMHMQPLFRECTYYGNWTSDLLYAQGLCLPSGSNLLKKDLDHVIEVIMKCYEVKSPKSNVYSQMNTNKA